MSVTVNDSNFDQVVLASDKPCLVDFWAEWCGPCRAIGPIIESLSQEFEGQATVCKVNVDENPDIAQRYNITSIPCVMMFVGGEVKYRVIGAKPASFYKEMLKVIY